MEIIKDMDGLTLSWYDEDRTILLLHASIQWDWAMGHELVSAANETVLATDRDVYTVYKFEPHVRMVPKGGAGLASLRNFMKVDPPNEKLVIFVGGSLFLQRLIEIASKIGFRNILDKYHFLESMDAALAVIEKHRAENQQEAQES